MEIKEIGLDLRFMQNPVFRERGVGRYAKCLLKALWALDDRDWITFKNIGYSLENSDSIPGKYIQGLSKKGLFQQHIQFPLTLLVKDVKMLHYLVHDHASIYSRQPFIVTVHDLIPVKFPEFNSFHGIKASLYTKIVGMILERAKAIIAISESTKSDIVECFNIDSEKINVVYHGIEEIYQPIEKGKATEILVAKYGIEGPYLLYLGGFDPRKNVAQLVEMFGKLRKEGLEGKLICVGPPAPYQSFVDVVNAIAKQRLYRDVFLIGFVSSDDLPLFYSAADLFLFPSAYEGFGFPILEAMSCGTPVIAFENSSIIELLSGSGVLVKNFQEMSRMVLNLLNDSKQYNSFRERGLARAKCFNWENTAKMTVDVYKKVLL